MTPEDEELQEMMRAIVREGAQRSPEALAVAVERSSEILGMEIITIGVRVKVVNDETKFHGQEGVVKDLYSWGYLVTMDSGIEDVAFFPSEVEAS